MGDVVNLRLARKQRERAAARRRTDAATATPPPDAERLKAEAELEQRRLEGHRRTPADPATHADPGADAP